MCIPPQLIVSIAFQGLKFIQQQKQDKAVRIAQIQQNNLARAARQRKDNIEKWNIRKKVKAEQRKAAITLEEAAVARSRAEVQAETVGGISVDRLMMDFYRQEGEYENAVLNQLDDEVFASEQRLEQNVDEQRANSTYVTNTQFLPNLASAGIGIAGSYFSWKSDQEYKDLLIKQNKPYFDSVR